jgi:hypothetical protein
MDPNSLAYPALAGTDALSMQGIWELSKSNRIERSCYLASWDSYHRRCKNARYGLDIITERKFTLGVLSLTFPLTGIETPELEVEICGEAYPEKVREQQEASRRVGTPEGYKGGQDSQPEGDNTQECQS